MGVNPKIGGEKTPKMDGENHGKPNPMNKWMIWRGKLSPPPIFGSTPKYPTAVSPWFTLDLGGKNQNFWVDTHMKALLRRCFSFFPGGSHVVGDPGPGAILWGAGAIECSSRSGTGARDLRNFGERWKDGGGVPRVSKPVEDWHV